MPMAPTSSKPNRVSVEWSIWNASMATTSSDFQSLITPIYTYLNGTVARQPLADVYFGNSSLTDPANSVLHARPVVGGVFVEMLTNPTLWTKWAGQDKQTLGTYAPFPATTVQAAILPSSRESAQTWKYTTSTQSGTPWTGTTFDDSGWSSGLGGFGGNFGVTADPPAMATNTAWTSPDIWIRKTFTMPQGTFSNLNFELFHDEAVQIYVNGTLAVSRTGFTTYYEYDAVPSSVLAQFAAGQSITIAVHCTQTTGGQGVDVGLVNLAPSARAIVPSAEQDPSTWTYTTATPTSDWNSTGFDDSSWSTGLSGFGTSSTPGAIVNTTWNSSDIWLRKTFTMPTGTFPNLQFELYHYGPVDVYIDGVLAASESGDLSTYERLTINPAALSLLVSGQSVTLAVHAQQDSGGQGVDVGIINSG
jgi:hypothetical protein